MPREPETRGRGGTNHRHAHCLEADLDRLEALDTEGLRAAWEGRHGAPSPSALPPRLLLLALVYDLQAATFGGLRPAVEKRLARIANGTAPSDTGKPAPIKLKPGTALVRDWGGRTWRAEVNADGTFAFDGRGWRSLSAIARKITGTSRNGPAFFGLRGGGIHAAG